MYSQAMYGRKTGRKQCMYTCAPSTLIEYQCFSLFRHQPTISAVGALNEAHPKASVNWKHALFFLVNVKDVIFNLLCIFFLSKKRLLLAGAWCHNQAMGIAELMLSQLKVSLLLFSLLLNVSCTIYVLLCIRRRSSDVYLGMSPNQNGGSNRMY